MIPPRWQPLVQLIGARFREFLREPEVIFWVYGFPLVLAAGLGYAFSNSKPEAPAVDVQPSRPARRGDRRTPARRPLAGRKAEGRSEPRRTIAKIGSRWARRHFISSPIPRRSNTYYDPARAESVQARYWAEAILARKDAANEIEPREVSEPGSRYIDFLLPGLIGMNVMGGGLFGVGFVLVDMRVRKLFKRMMATPMRQSDFLLSLLIARLALPGSGNDAYCCPSAISVSACRSMARIFTVFAVILVGAAAFAGIGLLLGSRTEKTESMSGMVNMLMLPMYIFSGVFFSSKRFPDEAQWVIQALPLTQMNDALREVMLEGKSFMEVSWRLGILSAYALVSFALALRLFKWR